MHLFFTEGENAVDFPSCSCHLRDAQHGMRQRGCPLLLTPVQTHVLPFRQVPLHAVIGGVAACTEPLDKVLGVFDSGKADELPPQSETPLLAMYAAAPPGAVDGITPVALVGEGVQGVFVARDRVAVVQGQAHSLKPLHRQRGCWLAVPGFVARITELTRL